VFALLPLLSWQVEDGIYHVSTNVPPLACYNLGLHQPILLILGRNVIEIASNQTMVYFLTHLTNASVLPGKMRKCENRIFSFWCCITALPELNQLLLDFISLHDLLYNYHTPWMMQLWPRPHPFYGPFSGTTRVSRCQKRTSGLYGARED